MTTPTDVSTILTKAQEVIDSAVQTVTATRATQNTLEQNIYTTDTKIASHNTGTTSHPDIRAQLTSLFNNPVVSGPNSVESGTEATWIFSVVPKFAGVSCENFVVTYSDGTSESLVASNNSATFTHTFTGPRNSETWFSVTAEGGGFISNSTQHNLTITQHMPPDMSQMVTTLPGRVSAGQSYTFQFAGIVDLDGDMDTVTAAVNSVGLTLNETSGLEENTDYVLTVGDINGPSTVSITFTATDTRGLSATRTFNMHLNAKPIVTGFAHTLPNHLNPGSITSFRVSGVTDTDADEELDPSTPALTYSVSSNNANITFSKNSGILQSEDINVIVSDQAAAGDSYTLTFTFIDSDGGTETATVSSTINVNPTVTGLVSTLPAYIVPGATAQSFALSGAVDSDGEAVTYSIPTHSEYLAFSKTVNITEAEALTYTVSGQAPRGASVSYTVRAMDASGGYTDKVFTVAVNQVVPLNSILADLGSVYAPDADHVISFTTGTDADGHTVTYTVTSSTTGVTITDGTDADAGDDITIHAPTTATIERGSTWTLNIAVDDGIETVNYTATIAQAVLPTITDTGDDAVTTTVTGITVQGGSENASTFSISGPSTDANGLALTYNIVTSDPDLTFSKTTGIAPNENVSITVAKVSVSTLKSFEITATNTVGETSEDSIEIEFTVDPIEVTGQPTITYPTTGATTEYYNGFTFTWSAATIVPDMDNSAAYPSDGSEP